MNTQLLTDVLRNGEGQQVEFKESLSSGAQNEALESLVAFANADGGHVFFGIRDNGEVKGVSTGSDTLERLVARIRSRTYPTLPVFADVIGDDAGAELVVVETAKDRPPVVGVYLLSSSNVDDEKPVETASLKCFRRVGRTNQRVELMALRASSPSDPQVILRLDGGSGSAGTIFPRTRYFYYSNGGPGWAHDVSFEVDHPHYTGTVSVGGMSLPPPNQEEERYHERPREAKLAVLNPDQEGDTSDQALRLHAVYRDGQGLTWRSTLELFRRKRAGDQPLYDFRPGEFSQRIITFPPKSALYGMQS